MALHEIQFRDDDRIIRAVGQGLGPLAGHTIAQVDDATWGAISAALLAPNGGVVYGSDGSITALPLAPSVILFDAASFKDTARSVGTTPAEAIRHAMPALTGYAGLLTVIGVDAGNGAMLYRLATFAAKRLNGGALAVGGLTVLATHADSGAGVWTAQPSTDGNDLVVTVTGAAGRTVDWLVRVEVDRFAPGGL